MLDKVSEKTKKWLIFLTSIVPIITLVASVFFWVDARYMHKDMSTIRHVDTQILVVEGHIENYERMRSMGFELSPRDERKYEMKMMQLQTLQDERNKLMGIGDSK